MSICLRRKPCLQLYRLLRTIAEQHKAHAVAPGSARTLASALDLSTSTSTSYSPQHTGSDVRYDKRHGSELRFRSYIATVAAERGKQAAREEMECWSCQHHLKKGGFICRGCEKIQPVDPSVNYFELFGMPDMQYDLDLDKLEKQYKMLQWQLHPDKAVGRTEAEREFSAQQATMVNMAYSVLRSPLARANYMLAQRGVSAGENSENTITDPELLMQVLEAREEVEATEDPAVLRRLLQQNRQQQARLVEELGEAFSRPTGTQDALSRTTELTYLVRLEQELVRKLPDAGA